MAVGSKVCAWCKLQLKAIHVSVSVYKGEDRAAEEHFCDQVCATHALVHFFDMMLAESMGAPKPPPRRRPVD